MVKTELPSLADIRDRLTYDPETGDLRWKWKDRSDFKSQRGYSTFMSTHVGKLVGTVSQGYRKFFWGPGSKCSLKACRVAFAMHHNIELWGLPEMIDHADLDGTNDRASNLRAATRSGNHSNRRAPRNNTSGVKGVSWYERYGKWRAYASVDGTPQTIGYFDTLEQAASARRAFVAPLHGEFYRE